MKLRVLPYKMNSMSARAVARSLQCLRVSANSHTYVPKRSHLIINWGLSTIPLWWRDGIKILNKFSSVGVACNKLKSFRLFTANDVSCPTYTTHLNQAEDYIRQGYKVYCRKQLTGHSGYGIIIASGLDELVEAPLYTVGVNAGFEYRVHVFNGKVIDYVKKGRRHSQEGEERPSHLIRNYSQGWVFIRESIMLPEVVAEESIKAVKALGLDFGAVDVAMIRGEENKCVVYEVNCSPGMEVNSTTCNAYVNAIKEYVI